MNIIITSQCIRRHPLPVAPSLVSAVLDPHLEVGLPAQLQHDPPLAGQEAAHVAPALTPHLVPGHLQIMEVFNCESVNSDSC